MLATLSLLFSTLPFVVALLLGLAVPLFALLLYRNFVAGLALVCTVFVLDAALLGSRGLYLGINVQGGDLAFGLLLVVAAARWLLAAEMRGRHGWVARAWLLFGALLVGGLLLGLAIEGRRAGAQARESFYLLACTSWAMSFAIDERRVRQVLHALAATALALLLLAAYRWAVYFVPVPELLPEGGTWGPVATRVIASHETLVIAQWLLLGLLFGAGSGAAALGRWLSPLLLAAVVALQHRSVWIAAAVGVLAAVAAGRRAQASRPLQLATLLAAAAMVLVPFVASERLSPLQREIGESMSTATAGTGTVHARLSDWRGAMREFAAEGPRTWLVGRGFGRDTRRLTITETGERRIVYFGLHNHYLSLLVNHGVIGLASYLAVLVATLAGLFRLARAGGGTPGPAAAGAANAAAVLAVLLAAQMAYHLPYAGDPLQHLILGVAIGFVASRRATPAGAGAALHAPLRAQPAAQDVAWR